MTAGETMSRATDRPHLFRNGGACVFCNISPEKVADRRAPPFCEMQDAEPDDRSGVDMVSGY